MSSSLQCLSNTVELTRYFLEMKFNPDINKDNVLGTGGKLAMQFAKMVKELWYETDSSYSPWNLKKVIGQFQPMVRQPC